MSRFFIFTILFLSTTIITTPIDSFEIYTTENSGLASNNITCIAIDGNGVKWFGHADGAGISTFDGNTWKQLSLFSQQYHDVNVNDILFDGNLVWAATEWGLYRYDGSVWYVIPETEEFPVKRLLKGPDGSLWFGGRLSPRQSYYSSRMTISQLKDGKLKTWFVDGFQGGMAFDNNGNLWVGCENTIYKYNGNIWTIYKSDDFYRITKIDVDSQGVLWFRTFYSVLTYNSQNWYTVLPDNFYSDLTFDKEGSIWAVLYDYMIVEVNSNVMRQYENLIHDNFSLIEVDIDNTLWLAGGDWMERGVVHLSINDLGLPYKQLTLDDAVQTIDVTSNQPPGDTLYDPEDYSPLSVGNTWVYRREFRPYHVGIWEPLFEDITTLTIVESVMVDNVLYYHFLDGRFMRKDEFGNIYEISRANGLRFDFTPCSEGTCVSGIYLYQTPFMPLMGADRHDTKVTIDNETFNGYKFYFGDMHGEMFTIVPGIGITSWIQLSDSGIIDNLYLEYARINGVEIGSATMVEESQTPIPFNVYRPYPNPFNSSVTIQYQLPISSHVDLVIYDILGRKIAVLKNEVMDVGLHSTVWDGKDSNGNIVGSGIYLYRMKADNYISKGKMMLMK